MSRKFYKIFCDTRSSEYSSGTLVNHQEPYQIDFMHGDPFKSKLPPLSDLIQVATHIYLEHIPYIPHQFDVINEETPKFCSLNNYILFNKKSYDLLRSFLVYPDAIPYVFYYEQTPFYKVVPPPILTGLTDPTLARSDQIYQKAFTERPEDCHYFRASNLDASAVVTDVFVRTMIEHNLKGFALWPFDDDDELYEMIQRENLG